jgi:5-(carboxyamino)imidazole ribonucleotide synthase
MEKIGVIGGGQLAWMMGQAAAGLGLELVVQTPAANDPAVSVAADVVLAQVDDPIATAALAAKVDRITFENEFVDLAALGDLAATGVKFYPALSALSPLLDKYTQREYLAAIDLPVPAFSILDRQRAMAQSEFPVVVKARRHGYDGQGTFVVKDRSQLIHILDRYPDTPLLIEAFVPFDRELAVIVARNIAGEIAIYPILETIQKEAICRRVHTAIDLPPVTIQQIEAIARTLAEKLEFVGLFAIELFHTADGKVTVNEIAPRTHNSGHLTIEACHTSQFAQLLRAVTGMPLGDSTLARASAVMVNLLGYENATSDYLPQRERIAAIPHAHLHWYGKTTSRIGRKLGHVTVTFDTIDRIAADRVADLVESIWYASAPVA